MRAKTPKLVWDWAYRKDVISLMVWVQLARWGSRWRDTVSSVKSDQRHSTSSPSPCRPCSGSYRSSFVQLPWRDCADRRRLTAGTPRAARGPGSGSSREPCGSPRWSTWNPSDRPSVPTPTTAEARPMLVSWTVAPPTECIYNVQTIRKSRETKVFIGL